MHGGLDVSIIIVNYNTRELIKNCLFSVFQQTKDIRFEVIVSDNGSTDGSVEMIKVAFPQVYLIENNVNLGFGAANNRGLKIASGKYIFYLNSDTVLLNNAVKIFFDYWENHKDEELGAIGCNLLNMQREIIHSYGFFPKYKKEIMRLLKVNISMFINALLWLWGSRQLHATKNEKESKIIGDVEYITGADLFMKNNHFAEYDERYFLYFEEVDLQYRLAKEGFKRQIIDGPKIIHLVGGSDTVIKESFDRYISFSLQQILISRIIWFKKNNYNKLLLSIIYILSQNYLMCFPFVKRTRSIRKKIKDVYAG